MDAPTHRKQSAQEPAGRRSALFTRPGARFLLLFVVLVLGLSLLIRVAWFNESVLGPYTKFITSIAGDLLELIGVPVEVTGSIISHPAFSVDIRHGCDGLEATLLLVCATIAYPFVSLRRRWLALGSGCLVIFILNMVRIVGLFLLGFKGFMDVFNFVHIYVAQFAIVTVVMLLWLFWVSGDRCPGGSEIPSDRKKPQPAG
jgi:exosortase H (IPTLxxWG-CTERM-specific)